MRSILSSMNGIKDWWVTRLGRSSGIFQWSYSSYPSNDLCVLSQSQSMCLSQADRLHIYISYVTYYPLSVDPRTGHSTVLTKALGESISGRILARCYCIRLEGENMRKTHFERQWFYCFDWLSLFSVCGAVEFGAWLNMNRRTGSAGPLYSSYWY